MAKGRVETLSDKEFIQICNKFHSLDEEGQVELIISQNDSAHWVGLLSPINKIIKGKTYSFGFPHKNATGYNRIINIFLCRLRDHMFSIRKLEFHARFEKLLTIEKDDFINAEIAAVQELKAKLKISKRDIPMSSGISIPSATLFPKNHFQFSGWPAVQPAGK